MAKTLLDTIKSNLAAPAVSGLGMEDRGETTQNLLRAKLGKASTDSGLARASSMQEQQALSQGRLGVRAVAQEGQLKSQEIQQASREVEQETEQKFLNIGDQLKDVQNKFALQSDEIMQDYARSKKDLTASEERARIEQLGVMLRLQNDMYIADLENEGQRARLDNDLSFKQEMAKSVFEDDEELFRNKLIMRSVTDASEREFREQLNYMDAKAAYEIGKAEAKAARKASMWKGIGNIVGSGTQAYAGGDFKKPPETETDYSSRTPEA